MRNKRKAIRYKKVSIKINDDVSDYARTIRAIDSEKLTDEDEFTDEFDHGYGNDEGYDAYEIRSTRVDFDRDYEETRGNKPAKENT